MRVRVDEPWEERHPWQLDHPRSGRIHIAGRPDGGDALAADEHDPTFSGLCGDAVEYARGAQENGRRGATGVSPLGRDGGGPEERSEGKNREGAKPSRE